MKRKSGISGVAHGASGASIDAVTAWTAFIASSIDKKRLVDNPDAVGAVGYITPRLVVKPDSGTDCQAACPEETLRDCCSL